MSRRDVGWVALFCLIPLLNFPRALLADRTLFLRDIVLVWAPQIDAVINQVARGEFPWLDARRGFGQPLFADPRAEVLYPPAWIHWILPKERSYSLFCAFHLVIAALGAARLARRLIPNASRAAQATAGFAFGAGGPMLSLVSHWHHLAAASWMPWIIEQTEPREDGRTRWLNVAALVTLQFFAGSPDYSFATFVACALRSMTRSDQTMKQRTRTGLALSLGVLMSAIQLLPSLAFSYDAGREPLPIGWALSPLHPVLTLETVIPFRTDAWPLRPEARLELLKNAQVWMFSHYLGLSVWILALLGLGYAGRSDRRFLCAALVLGLVASLGVTNIGLQSVIARIPLVSGLRFPTKHLILSSLALAILAAWGVSGFESWRPQIKRRAAFFGGFSTLAAALLFAWSTGPGVSLDPAALIGPAIALLAAMVILWATPGRRARLLLPAAVAIDLLAGNRAINPTTPATLLRDRPPLTAFIPKGSRIYVSDYSMQLRRAAIRTPAGPNYELRQVPVGYQHPEALALAATWYLNPPTAGRFGYFGSFDTDILDFYRRPLQRMVEDFASSRDRAKVMEELRRGSVEYVVTMDPPDLWSGLPLIREEAPFFAAPVRLYSVPGSWPRVRFETTDGKLKPEPVRIREMRDSVIRLEGSTSQASRVVVSFANERGWKATVDGRSVPIEDTPLAFISVPVPAGAHQVSFAYTPPLLALGALISVLATTVIGLLEAKGRTAH